MSIPTFLGISNYTECIKFWLEHDEKHKFQYGDKKFYLLIKYANFLVFFTQISIIRVLSHKSSQRFLLPKNKYHTYNNIRDWNPFGFICLLKYIHYSYRAWPHFGDNKVSTGASTEAKRSPKGTGPPPQAALESFHAENLQYSLWQQGWPHDDNHVPVHNNDAKHLGVKIPQSIHNTGKYATCLSVQSLWL